MINDAEKESCAVCWRDFSSAIRPVLLPCGHTYCTECSASLRSCPLCRKKVPTNYCMPMNYSLLSLIEKNEAQRVPETRAQETQTEEHQATAASATLGGVGPAQHIARRSKATSKQAIKFKFSRSPSGVLEGMEICML